MQLRADKHAHSLKVIERAPYKVPPLYQFKPPDGSSPLRRFIALPEETLLVLGARRTPPVIPPPATSNTNATVSVCTSVGFRPLKAEDYAGEVEKLKPDIVVGLGDIPYGRALGSKRMEKATDRSIEWMQDHVALRNIPDLNSTHGKLFAPLLPVSCSNQQFYVDCLTQDLANEISGLAIYSMDSLEDLPESLYHHPRLAFIEPNTPHQVLRQIMLGVDVLTVPFISAATDAGIALTFSFPSLGTASNDHIHATLVPLGIDMWYSTHAAELSPLVSGCKCYTCTSHHRAYIQHLLAAKEMLGWVLLQIHNHHVIDQFFCDIRQSIADGTFDANFEQFEKVFEPQLPEGTGQGPRVRGYQYKSEGPGEPRKNKAAFTVLNDGREKIAESTPPSGEADAEQLEGQGFAEKNQ